MAEPDIDGALVGGASLDAERASRASCSSRSEVIDETSSIGLRRPGVHVVACLFLIVVVLLQTGKGADMGAVFGGGSQTLFGSSGAGNFLTKLTTGTAIVFMVTSLILTYGSTRTPTSDLIDRLPPRRPRSHRQRRRPRRTRRTAGR